MAVSFHRTTRSLNADRGLLTIIGILLITTLVGAWLAWLLAAKVVVYGVSRTARLEADGAAYTIQSLYTGRVARNNLLLGQAVKQGDVLLELEVNVQQLELLEQQTGDVTLDEQITSIKNKIAAEQRALSQDQRAAQLGIEEAEARVTEADAAVAAADS